MDVERVYNKLDDIEAKITKIQISLARLPHEYVPRSEMATIEREAASARRWAVGVGLTTIMSLIGFAIAIF